MLLEKENTSILERKDTNDKLYLTGLKYIDQI